MEWVYREAAHARARIGATDRIPTEGDLLELIERSGVRLLHAPVPCAYCSHSERGVTIVLPLHWRGEEQDKVLAHECGHALTRPGYGNILRRLRPGCPRAERLAQLWDRRDEQIADAFVSGWFGGARR